MLMKSGPGVDQDTLLRWPKFATWICFKNLDAILRIRSLGTFSWPASAVKEEQVRVRRPTQKSNTSSKHRSIPAQRGLKRDEIVMAVGEKVTYELDSIKHDIRPIKLLRCYKWQGASMMILVASVISVTLSSRYIELSMSAVSCPRAFSLRTQRHLPSSRSTRYLLQQ